MAVFLPLAEAAAPELEAAASQAATKAAPELEQGLQQGLKQGITKEGVTPEAGQGIESQLSNALGQQVNDVVKNFSPNSKGQLFDTSSGGGTTVDNLANKISQNVFHPKIDEFCSTNGLSSDIGNTLKGFADQATSGFLNKCVGEIKNTFNQEGGELKKQLSDRFAMLGKFGASDFGLENTPKIDAPEHSQQLTQKPQQDSLPVSPSPEPSVDALKASHRKLPDPTDSLRRPSLKP